MTFQELKLTTPLLNALNDLGFKNPTPIQEKAYPVILSGRDAVGIAQTGTGKTFAYLLPLIRQLKYSETKHPRILIVVPTRELVLQVVGEVEKLTKYMNLRVVGVYGGTNINTQRQVVFNGMDILVATPGRLVDLVMTGVLRMKSIQKLVIDEVDEMLNLGFRPQLMSFMESLPQKRQNLMFSATLTDEVAMLIESYFYEPITIEIENQRTPLEQIVQYYYTVPNFFTKINLLGNLLANSSEFERVLIFVASKQLADRVFDLMDPKFPDQIGVLHSNKSQNLRINSLERFKNGTSRILIATDVASRGLDIADISHVINFDVPDISEDYIHRIGRTGRSEKAGIALTFVNEPEMKFLLEIGKFMDRNVIEKTLPDGLIISDTFTDEERPVLFDKDYLGKPSGIADSQGAYHEKKEKNKKVNLGGPGERKPRKDKPENRGVLRKRAAKKR
ncbi:MAG: DEAD/DEAH box helicase [Bacteroidota bacterium]|nr:DEAD/DEAH box helicase [Odoribacter sp.]MDP3644020.1 DEAD/DEAH box helicase [Bacteroidota bacterium]